MSRCQRSLSTRPRQRCLTWYIWTAPGDKSAPLSALVLLQAYGELAATKPEYLPRYLAILDQLSQFDPNHVLVQAALGHRDLLDGRFQDAMDHLVQAMKLGDPGTAGYSDLADALVKLGRPEEAVPVLEKSIDLNPYSPVPQKTLMVLLIRLKQYQKAQQLMEQYVATFPQDTYIRRLLEMAKTGAKPQ